MTDLHDSAHASADTSNDMESQLSFGAWLLAQRGAGGFVGGLANAAAADRTFPRTGSVDAARNWLQGQRPSGDDWEAMDDAESAWLRS